MSDNSQEKDVEEKKQDVLAEHILRAAGLSSDDLMSFQHVFRDASSTLCTLLSDYTSTVFISEVIALESLMIDDVPDIVGTNTLIVTFEAERWGGNVLFVLDAELVNLVTDAFFGAADISLSIKEQKKFSAVEVESGKKLALLLTKAMDAVFGIGDGKLLNYHKTQFAYQFDLEAYDQSRLFSCRLSIKIADVQSTIHILMPRSCHRPIQEAVTRVLRAPSAKTDPLWAKKLRQEVTRAHVNIEAFIVQGTLALNDIAHLKKGQVLQLPVNTTQQIRLRSGNKPLYKCSLGKVGENFSVRVKDPIDEEEEMIDELVSG